MEQRIVESIAKRLNESFPDYPILDRVADQNVGRPAFFISITDASIRDRITHGGFFKRYIIEILFEPDAGYVEPEIRRVQDELTFLLRRIPDIEGEADFRPYWTQFHSFGGLLHCTFNLRESFLPKKEDDPRIRRYAIGREIKN